ncbi:MAG: hypothetical protein R3E31_14960 [Chloroflexota bacterium]
MSSVSSLDIKYEDLPGEDLRTKTISLVDYCRRYDRIPDLLRILQEKRPSQFQRHLSNLPTRIPQLPIQIPKLWQQLRQRPKYVWGIAIILSALPLLWLGRGSFGGGTTPTRSVVVTNITPPPNAQQGDRWTRPSDGMVLVYVPGGTFLMGSDPAQDSGLTAMNFRSMR